MHSREVQGGSLQNHTRLQPFQMSIMQLWSGEQHTRVAKGLTLINKVSYECSLGTDKRSLRASRSNPLVGTSSVRSSLSHMKVVQCSERIETCCARRMITTQNNKHKNAEIGYLLEDVVDHLV